MNVIKGHHIYEAIWTHTMAEELSVQSKDDNRHNEHIITPMKDGQIISPIHLSPQVRALLPELIGNLAFPMYNVILWLHPAFITMRHLIQEIQCSNMSI